LLHSDLTDQYRPGDSLIHRLDPRVKTVAALLMILVTSLTPAGAWPAFGLLLLSLTSISLVARLGPVFAMKRAFIAFPFALAALPILFTTPGAALLQLPIVDWPITAAGLVRFGSLLLRMWLAVQAGILLTAATPFADLTWALGELRMPRPLVAIIAFMYRYLFVLADEGLRLLRARSARSASQPGSRRPSIAWQGRVAGGMVGSLLLRALERSERVYSAMLARGYDGQVRLLRRFSMSTLDWAALAAGGAAAGLVLLAGR